MTTPEPAAPAPAAEEKKCCRSKSCCDKKGCGTNGKCCVCCGNLPGYLGAALLTLIGLTGLFLWLGKINPTTALYLFNHEARFSGASRFFMTAGRWLGLNFVALPLLLVAVVVMHLKCCARCAVRLLFAYGLLITLIALGGLASAGIDLAINLR